MQRVNIELPPFVRTLLAPIITILVRVRTSIVYFIFFVGFLFLVAAIILQDGVMAGLFGIFAFTSILYAALAYIGLRLIGYPKIGGYE